MLIVLGGCASQPGVNQHADLRIDGDAGKSPTTTRRAAYEYHVLAGEMALQRKKPGIAAKQYVAALQYSGDAELARRATRIALYADDARLAYQAAGRWAAAAPDSLDAQRAATRLALANDDRDGLAAHAPRLVAAAESQDKGYRLLAELLSAAPAHAQLAIDTVSRLAGRSDASAAAQYALGLVALRYDRDDAAARAADRAMAIDPESGDAALLQAAVWIRGGQTRKAQALIDDLPGDDATGAQHHMALARILIDADRDDVALEEFQRALDLRPDNVDARFGLALLALRTGDLARAERVFDSLYQAGQRRDAAAYYLGRIHEQRAEYARAQRWYERIDDGSHAFNAQVRAARMIDRQGDLAGARARLDKLRAKYPDNAESLYAAEAQLLVDASRPEDALSVYDQALAQRSGDAELLYGRSLVLERLGRVDDSQADLRAVLEKDPDDVRALNALGYLLTNHSGNYDRALDYIQRALDAAPDNPAVLDSMGWVQYRLGNLAQARHYLERAYDGLPDPEVAAHLGEVLWQQGNRDAARRLWQHARADNPGDATLQKTMARFSQTGE